MKDEIKEILENMKEISSYEYTTDWFELNCEDTKILLDYISDLQEGESYYYGQYCVYKSKIEKAIEYIKSYNIDFENIKFGEAPLNINDLQKLLNILQGVGKDE